MILRSMALMTTLNVAKAGAALLISIAIAGVVAPDEFGLVAFAIPLMAFITLVTDFGLSSAIVRHPELDRRQAGAAVCVMGIAGLLGAVVLGFGAASIEAALGLHGATSVLQGFALVTACSIWATGPRALLERGMAYPGIVAVEATALVLALIGFGIGIAMSAGIMALVVFHVVLQAIRAGAFTWLARKLMQVNLNLSSINPLVQVGGWVFITNLLSYCARNLDRMLIGSVLGAASVGLYGLGYQFMTIPLILISWPVSGVLLSTLSRMDGNDKPDMIRAVVTATASITLPMMAFMMFGTRYPFDVFYANRWDGLADIVMILSPVGAIQAIAVYASAVLVQKGAVKLNFSLGLLNGLALSAVFLVTVWHGLMTMVISYAMVASVVSATMIYFMCREGGIDRRSFFRCLFPGFSAAVAGAFAVAVSTGFHVAAPGDWASMVAIYAACAGLTLLFQRERLLTTMRALVGARVSLAPPR